MTLPLSAAISGNYYFTDKGSTIEIYGWINEPSGALVIPSTISGKPVTSIASSTFYLCRSITSVTIASSITTIGDSAFTYCSGVTSLTISSSVTRIGNKAFQYCSGLTSLTIPSGVTSIGNNAFDGCTGLTSLTILSGVTRIGDFAFSGCSKLTSLTIPSSVTDIGTSAFSGWSGLTSVTIPSSVITIRGPVFSDCHKLASISVDAANPNYSSIAGVLFDKLQTTLIQCPCGMVGAYAIPSGVTTIGLNAFAQCWSLTSLTIPSSVTSIDNSAFPGCSGLLSISVDVANPKYSSKAGVLFDKLQTTLIKCPVSMAGAYAIPPSVTSIGTSAFSNCSKLTSLTIPSGVTSIGDWAFSGCSGFASANLTIPSGVTSIGSYTFQSCGLASVIIPSGVTSIGTSAFSGCSKLTSAEFLGNAPAMGGAYMSEFAYAASGFTVKYHSGTINFTSPTWEGYPAVNIGPLPILLIATNTLPTGSIGVAFNQVLQATGGLSPYTWSLVSGSLPSQLTLASNGTISGTPTAAMTASFTVQVISSDSQSTTANFTLTINSLYSTWQTNKFTAADIATGLTTMTADFDGDGLPNILEYAFGTNAKAAAASPVAVNVSGNNLQISFPCDATCKDISYTVQSSFTLVANSWIDIAKSTGGATTVPLGALSTVSDSSTGLRTVTVTDATALPVGGQRFLRVKVTAP